MLLRNGYYRPRPGWVGFFAKVCVASAVLALVIQWLTGPDSAWLHAHAVYKVGRLGLVVGCAALAYFATLFALGFRVADFNRREAVPPHEAPAQDVADVPD
jgi:putative peptidoglycan lipid II flippase